MKKLIILLFTLLALCDIANAQYLNDVVTKIKGIGNEKSEIKKTRGYNNQPVCADSSFKDIQRADLDITFTVDIIDSPGEGRYDFYFLNNYHINANYNLSSSFFAYGWIGKKEYKKTEVSDSLYDPEWKAWTAAVGVGIYVTPILSVHVGFGKVFPENKNGASPDQGFALDYGIDYDIPIENTGNKIVVSLRVVESGLATEDIVTAAQLQGSASYFMIGVGYSVPFDR